MGKNTKQNRYLHRYKRNYKVYGLPDYRAREISERSMMYDKKTKTWIPQTFQGQTTDTKMDSGYKYSQRDLRTWKLSNARFRV